MPSEVVRDAILPRVTLATGKRSSGYLAVPVWSTARAGGAMIWRTRRKPPQVGCMRASASASLSRKGRSGKARTKTGIRKSDLPGLQGGPRKRDVVFMTKCARLGSIPTQPPSIVGLAKESVDGGAVARGGLEDRGSPHRVAILFGVSPRRIVCGARRGSTANC
jgi:hypothetical protein